MRILNLIFSFIIIFCPILFIALTIGVIVYDIKSKASTAKKVIISIFGIGFVPAMWILISILKVVMSISSEILNLKI